MSNRNKLIICLLIVGVALFSIVQFIIIPERNVKQADYKKNQNDSLTHNILSVEKYKNQYIGNNSNTTNLFYNLPLNSISMKFQINSEDCSLTVSYLDTVQNIGDNKVRRDIIYNSVAAMALIDNLSKVTYEFSGESFEFSRDKIQQIFGDDLSKLIDQEIWETSVQTKLSNDDFVKQFYELFK